MTHSVGRLALVLLLTASAVACSTDRDETAMDSGSASGDEGAGSGGANGAAGEGVVAGDLPSETAELKTQVGDTIHFALDSSEIDSAAGEILRRQAAYMQKYPNLTFTIEGNCDERGTREYNLALGQRRAEAAKTALVALGVSAQRLQTISYGKERPLIGGAGQGAWAQNRRDTTIIN